MSITRISDFFLRLGTLASSAALLAGCGPGAEAPTAAAPSAAAPAARGEVLSYACQACHSLGPDGGHQIGPTLWGVFGREAGTVAGFDFSAALRDSGLVWSPAALDDWLLDPAGFLPGTTMAFTGYQAPEDRDALIRFLEAATTAPPVAR